MSTAEAATSATAAPRRVQLDGLRATAVGLVLVHHFGGPAAGLAEFGPIGVHLFFVISGFLITGKLLAGRDAVAAGRATRSGVMRDYYWRRALRILPIYLLVIAAGAAVGMPDVRADWPWLVTFTGNLRTAYTGHFLGFLAPTWTLNIEEQFYLVWPWIVLGAAAARLPRIVLATVVAGPLWRAGATLAGVSAKSVAVFTLSAFDALGLGAWLALRWRAGGGDDAPPVPAAAAWAGAALFVHGSLPGPSAASAATWTLGVALVGVWLVDRTARGFGGVAGRVLSWRPAVYLGVISYGVYLYHLPVLWVARGVAARLGGSLAALPPLAQFVLLSGVSVGVAAASWELFEKRINRLKDRVPTLEREPAPTVAVLGP